MTSLKLFYRRGAPAALLLGLIVGAPDIAQAIQLRGVLPQHPAAHRGSCWCSNGTSFRSS